MGDYDFNLTYPAVQCWNYAANSDHCEMKAPVVFILRDLWFFAKANIPGQ